RRAVEQREGDDAGEQDRGGGDGERAPDPAAAGGVADARVAERVVEVGEGARPAGAPAQVVVESVVAPQEAARAAAVVPLARGGAQLIAQAGAVGVVAPPLDQARPRDEQGLVDDLDAM